MDVRTITELLLFINPNDPNYSKASLLIKVLYPSNIIWQCIYMYYFVVDMFSGGQLPPLSGPVAASGVGWVIFFYNFP